MAEKNNPIEEKILEATQTIEEQLDAEIERLDKLDLDELSEIKRKRIALMKKDMKFKEEWITKGHGEYSTLSSERELFDILKKSEKVVMHAYRSSTMRCGIVDKHLDILARKHLEAKFCKLDVEKAPRICSHLKIKVLPSIVLFKENKPVDMIVGFDDLGGVDDFSTEMMEWRIARAGVITYDGDLSAPPEPDEAKKTKRSFFTFVRKNIRGGSVESDSEDDEEATGDT